MKELDLESLADFDGKEGRPVYIVYQGKVFDVSQSKLWKGGLHMRRHHAGRDLSTDLSSAPHGVEVFERYPQVGVLKEDASPERSMPGLVSELLSRYPMLRRHPHPMTVHFPLAFFIASTAFTLLYLITGHGSFEVTALNSLGAGLLSLPIVMATGLFSWWLNYMAKPMHTINVKITASMVLLIVATIAFMWRLSSPDILTSFRASSVLYLLLIVSFIPLVSVIGWYGAKLTFPVEKD